MRPLADAEQIRRLMRRLGAEAAEDGAVYLTGGATKLERGHVHDLEDVKALVERGLVDPQRALAYFDEIEGELYRYPALDPKSFRERVEAAFLAR